MAIWIKDQRAKIDKYNNKENIKRSEKSTLANISTSRKDQQSGEYKYSGFGFVRFVGKAHDFMKSVKDGDVIVIKTGIITREAYMKDDQRMFPKNEQITVFDAELFKAGNGNQSASDEMEELPEDPDQIPF